MWKLVEPNIYKWDPDASPAVRKQHAYRVDVTVNGYRKRPEAPTRLAARTLLSILRASDRASGDAPSLPYKRAPITIQKAVEAFAEHRSNLGLSKKTTGRATRLLGLMVEVVGREVKLPLTASHVSSFLAHIGSHGLKISSQQIYLSQVSTFANWCAEEGYGPTPKIPKLKDKKGKEKSLRPYRILSEIEEARMRAAASTNDRWMGVWRAVEFSLLTGMRISEMEHLTWDDIGRKRITVYSEKTDTVRWIPLRGRLKGLVAELRASRGSSGSSKGSQRVFQEPSCSNSSNHFKQAWKALRSASRVRGFTFHGCRHTFVSRCVQRGVPLPVVQKLAGHASIEMTMHYVHTTDEDIERGYAMAFG